MAPQHEEECKSRRTTTVRRSGEDRRGHVGREPDINKQASAYIDKKLKEFGKELDAVEKHEVDCEPRLTTTVRRCDEDRRGHAGEPDVNKQASAYIDKKLKEFGKELDKDEKHEVDCEPRLTTTVRRCVEDRSGHAGEPDVNKQASAYIDKKLKEFGKELDADEKHEVDCEPRLTTTVRRCDEDRRGHAGEPDVNKQASAYIDKKLKEFGN